jgi:MFS family permease
MRVVLTPKPPFGNAFRQSVSLLLTRRFRTFWFASLLASIGTWAQQVAQPWLMMSLGASSILLGLDSFALGAPGLLLTVIGGTLADQADRRIVIAFCQSIQMLCPVLIVVLILTGTIQPWIIVALSLVVGMTDALSMPSFQTIVSTIIDREQFATGLSLNATQFNLSRILGPAIAGILMASVGAVGAFSVSAASYRPFILIALWILPRRKHHATEDSERPSIHVAIRQIGANPVPRGTLLTVLVTSLLCSPLLTFCPLLVAQVFHGSVGHFSLTIGAFGVGGLLAATGLLAVDPARDRRPLASRFALAFSAVVVASAVSPWSWGLPLLFAMGGVAMTVANVSANAFLQAAAPAHMRGRSIGLYMLAMRGGVSVGSLLTGISVELLGVRGALLANELLALGLHVVIARAWASNRDSQLIGTA